MNKNRIYSDIKIDFFIPAFDSKQQGLIVDLKLQASPNAQFRIKTSGSIAQALERSFIRVIEIMSSLNASWSCLGRYQYKLISSAEQYRVKDARSAELSLCIAALNVVRNHKQLASVNKYIGTGILRVDGSFSQTSLEDTKEKAALVSQQRFINTQRCGHIFELDNLLSG